MYTIMKNKQFIGVYLKHTNELRELKYYKCINHEYNQDLFFKLFF